MSLSLSRRRVGLIMRWERGKSIGLRLSGSVVSVMLERLRMLGVRRGMLGIIRRGEITCCCCCGVGGIGRIESDKCCTSEEGGLVR